MSKCVVCDDVELIDTEVPGTVYEDTIHGARYRILTYGLHCPECKLRYVGEPKEPTNAE